MHQYCCILKNIFYVNAYFTATEVLISSNDSSRVICSRSWNSRDNLYVVISQLKRPTAAGGVVLFRLTLISPSDIRDSSHVFSTCL